MPAPHSLHLELPPLSASSFPPLVTTPSVAPAVGSEQSSSSSSTASTTFSAPATTIPDSWTRPFLCVWSTVRAFTFYLSWDVPPDVVGETGLPSSSRRGHLLHHHPHLHLPLHHHLRGLLRHRQPSRCRPQGGEPCSAHYRIQNTRISSGYGFPSCVHSPGSSSRYENRL